LDTNETEEHPEKAPGR